MLTAALYLDCVKGEKKIDFSTAQSCDRAIESPKKQMVSALKKTESKAPEKRNAGEKHETHSHHNFYTHESTTYFDRRKE